MLSLETLVDLLPLSVTLAILIAIVSLLACSVTDGLMGEKHNSNQELIAEACQYFLRYFPAQHRWRALWPCVQ